ncbi:MAG: phenylacetic acid degradation operon negative regulatory protein PaaX [Alphaproteobacteria bacterium]|nr:phenylacetic acid degradation operon negative regulatory protein PaaX [Alphaproteobacteria bacterium]
MSESFDHELDVLIDEFHAQERLRIWSLVITIFGDAVVPRGGEFWLGSLQELMQRLRIEPNALRAAMSRLTADGWLKRVRVGRNSFYQLAEAGKAEFAAGTKKIYGPQPQGQSDEWTIIVLTGGAGSARDIRRAQLRAAGFGSLSPTVFVLPGRNVAIPEKGASNGEFVFQSDLSDETTARDLVASAWPLDEIETGYRSLIEAFTPLAACLAAGSQPGPLSSIAARSLLIHRFRRMVLRDPQIPNQLRPVDWQGNAARQLVSDLYRQLAAPSEQWLDQCRNASGDQLQSPGIDVANRFGG